MTVIAYHRPSTMEEALAWLSQENPVCVPLGGGTGVNHFGKMKVGVVDLQRLGLNAIDQEGARIRAGATATLQSIMESPLSPPALKKAVELEASINQRQVATMAGRLVTADGRSPLAAALLAMDAELIWEPGEVKAGIGDWLPLRTVAAAGKNRNPGLLITSITWPARMAVAFHYVARTPADRPIVCVGAAGWSSGRRRVALGGFGQAPLMVMDGPEAGGAEEAAKDAYSQAGDEWSSASYRQEIAAVLTRRCLQELEGV